MRKSKAVAVIRKRKRNGGLIYKPNEDGHPLILAIKALTAFTEGTITLMRMIAEADDKEAMAKMMESEGLFKLHQDTGAKITAGITKYNERIEALYRNNE